MKLMVFSNDSWDDTNATGNTLSNLFGGNIWKNDIFSNVYIKSSYPNNNICNNYYKVTLLDIIKHYFFKEKIGNEFIYNNDFTNIDNTLEKKEKKIIDYVHKHSIKSIYLIADYLYRRKKWINKKFIEYIDNFQPDIFYAHINNFAFLSPLIRLIKNRTNAKIVILLTDNLYEDIDNKFILRRRKLKKEYKEIIDYADKIYAISEELKKEYSIIFKKNIEVLYKGCLFEYPIKKKTNSVIKFVYAGNMFYGRDRILSQIAKAIQYNNSFNGKKAFLEIYTGATLTNDLKELLNIEGCSQIIGKKDYEEIKKIENDADYVLHVESFEKKQIEYVKYSFSTKIIDCLQSGSCLVGVGPSEIASIKYIEKVPGAHIISNINEIADNIISLINNDKIVEESNIIRNYAKKNHDINMNREKMRKSFERIIND